jgi:hypothetical protein
MSDFTANAHRRKILLGLGALGITALFPTPIEKLLQAMVSSFIHQARAAGTSAPPRNYINIFLRGAPPRFLFDHWQKTQDGEPDINPNLYVSTRYSISNHEVVGFDYRTIKYNGVLVPEIFGQSVTTSAGARSLSDLLDSMLVIRGYGSGMDGHATNATMQMAPLGGVSTISGLAADYSTKIFPAIQYPDRLDCSAYYSSTGNSLTKLENVPGGPLQNLFAGFAPADHVLETQLQGRNQTAFDLATAQLQNYASSNNPGAANLNRNLNNAIALMKKGVGDISSYWPGALSRYKNIVETAMRTVGLPGISDAALVSDGSERWKTSVLAPVMILGQDFDARDCLANMSAASLCEGLAMAEYVLTQNYATSVELFGGNSYENIRFKGISTAGGVSTPTDDIFQPGFDIHEMGAAVSLLLNNAYFRGLGAGLLELMDSLKSVSVSGANVWAQTVMQITSDFGRIGRVSGNGSDHGWNQMISSAFCGAIKGGPFVVGNVQTTSPIIPELGPHFYDGSQGLRAPIPGYLQALPTPTMLGATVATLLNVPSNPFQNAAPSLVDFNAGAIQFPFGQGQLLEGT